MNPDIFSREEQKQLLECVASIEELPIYQSSEFESIFGLSQDEIAMVLQAFPKWDLHNEETEGVDHSWLAINNAFAWLMNGTEEDKNRMKVTITFPDVDLDPLYNKFRDQIHQCEQDAPSDGDTHPV